MNGGIMHLSIILLVKRGIVFQLDKIIDWDKKKENVFFLVHGTVLASLCSGGKVTASTVSPCSCLLREQGLGNTRDPLWGNKKWKIWPLTCGADAEGAFCRWLNAASAGIQAHPSLLITCAIPIVTPEVLLSPAIQGRFFYSLPDLGSVSLLRCVSSEFFSNCLQPVSNLTCENNENACTWAFLCLPVEAKRRVGSWMPRN